MCGIFGKLAFGKAARLSTEQLRDMGDRIRHRGPDDDGMLIDGPLALGMRRLSIIDIAGGKQPIFDESGKIGVVLNGEIYNFRELRNNLEQKGHRFRTRSDTEVVVHLYEERGIGLLNELRGMFAFALWDGHSGKLYLARDRVGKKPLVYAVTPAGITFASEIKALFADASVSRDIDPAAVDQYFTMNFVPHPRTIFTAIRKLPPAHYLVASANGVESVQRYWSLRFQPKTKPRENEAKETLVRHLRNATETRLVSDVPLGLLLSGGLDSSAVAVFMAESCGGKVKTFSVGFENAPESDELPYAQMVAKHIGAEHHPIRLKMDVLDHLPKLAAHLDEPFGDSSILPSFLVAREARKYVTVVLNGDGGDEAFAGYPRYADVSRLAGIFAACPAGIRNVIREKLLCGQRHPQREGNGWMYHKLRKILIPAHRCIFQPESFSAVDKYRLYGADFRSALNGNHWDEMMSLMDQAETDTRNVADTLIHVDLNLYLPGDLLVKMDMATMANSLEARSPFLDHRLLEWAASLDASFKIGDGQKRILRDAVRDKLPTPILTREKKGFGLPLRKWIREELRPMIQDILLDRPAGIAPYFDVAAVKREIESILIRPRGDEKKIWALLMFELWARNLKSRRQTVGS